MYLRWQNISAVLIFSLLACNSLAQTAASLPVRWTCTAPDWVINPYFKDGILIGRVGSNCSLSGAPKDGPSRLFHFLRSDVEKSGRYTVHSPAKKSEREHYTGVVWDVTDSFSEEEDSLSIRQNMFLGLAPSKALLYETQSTEVKASGRASALQKVIFRTVFHPSQIRFENEVHLDRPWYAFPPFLFRKVSKSVIEEKFLKARDLLIQHLAPHI